MLHVQEDFRIRSNEIGLYVMFLREFGEHRVEFLDPPDSAQPSMLATNRVALFKTLKANLFLLLYNLIESTVKNAIEAIFDELRVQNVSFDDCSSEVRKIVLTNLRKHNIDKILPNLSTISVDVVVTTFMKDELFRGNVDGRRIRQVAKEYGFSNPVKKSGELLTVKTSRNDLAHGNKSFEAIGRDFSVERLAAIKEEVVLFLEELLANVANYIATRAYLA